MNFKKGNKNEADSEFAGYPITPETFSGIHPNIVFGYRIRSVVKGWLSVLVCASLQTLTDLHFEG
jgi:hypothetical protein